MASFLGRHGEKQRVLPTFMVVQPARAGEAAINAGGEVTACLCFWRHRQTMLSKSLSGKPR